MQQITRKDNVQKLKDGISEAIVKRAQENDDVCFWWRTFCSTVEVDITLQKHSSLKLLSTTSFAARWMEAYKCKRKKCPEV